MAYVAIRLGHVSQHKEWVLRSYVVTFTFVTTRTLAELGILPSLGRDPYATLVWLCWSMASSCDGGHPAGTEGDGSQRRCLTRRAQEDNVIAYPHNRQRARREV